MGHDCLQFYRVFQGSAEHEGLLPSSLKGGHWLLEVLHQESLFRKALINLLGCEQALRSLKSWGTWKNYLQLSSWTNMLLRTDGLKCVDKFFLQLGS